MIHKGAAGTLLLRLFLRIFRYTNEAAVSLKEGCSFFCKVSEKGAGNEKNNRE
jgi:hypothetical protein